MGRGRPQPGDSGAGCSSMHQAVALELVKEVCCYSSAPPFVASPLGLHLRKCSRMHNIVLTWCARLLTLRRADSTGNWWRPAQAIMREAAGQGVFRDQAVLTRPCCYAGDKQAHHKTCSRPQQAAHPLQLFAYGDTAAWRSGHCRLGSCSRCLC